jgi:CRP/FNR family transcriptional regulator
MDALVDDGFARSLNEEYRFGHEVLKNYGFYVNSNYDQRMDLLRIAKPIESPDGQPLIEAGHACRDVVLVGRGRIRVYIAGASGREVTLYYVHRGESCPVNLGAAVMEMGAFANAESDDDLAALAIAASDFRQLGHSNPALRDYVFSATVLRFGEIIALIREITTKRVDHRLAEYLLRKFDDSGENPPVAVETQQNIALELGTAREVVSRRLQELDNIGAVELRRGKVILRDRLALHRVIT